MFISSSNYTFYQLLMLDIIKYYQLRYIDSQFSMTKSNNV